ncbi:hypothetical protein BJX96DRAFT_171270 [Aspergillus floccosus]
MNPTPEPFQLVAKNGAKSRAVLELVTGATLTIYMAYRLIRCRKRLSSMIFSAEAEDDFRNMNGCAGNAQWNTLAARRVLLATIEEYPNALEQSCAF